MQRSKGGCDERVERHGARAAISNPRGAVTGFSEHRARHRDVSIIDSNVRYSIFRFYEDYTGLAPADGG